MADKPKFFGKTKVKFYMKSGNVITIKFDSFEITKLTGTKENRRMEYKNPSVPFTLDIDEIEAVTLKKVLF